MTNGEAEQTGITIVGLGPGDTGLITRQVWEWLQTTPKICVRTRHHPCVPHLPSGLAVTSFDDIYETAASFEEVYRQIVDRVLELGSQPGGITYGVPGHPFVAEATCPEIVRAAEARGLPVRVMDGLSFIEPTLSALGIDPLPQMVLMDALDLGRLQHPAFPPSMPALITQIYSRQVASDLKLTLMAVYPDEHRVQMVHAAGTDREDVEELMLYEIDRSDQIGLTTCLYLPALGKETAFEAFQELVARLRAADGCPWDREQTHLSLRQHLLEETYETLSALDSEEPASLREELGDLLLQIVLHAQIAAEEGEFTMGDVLKSIHQKIVRRHPHVFGDLAVSNVSGVLANWEKIKETERSQNKQQHANGLLDGVPQTLPSLSQAQELQDRAARVGFDWDNIKPVLDKVREELDEALAATDASELESELGDLLFAVVNFIRWNKVDAESALRQTNLRFRKRYAYIEAAARADGKRLTDMTLAEMDSLWEEAKKGGY